MDFLPFLPYNSITNSVIHVTHDTLSKNQPIMTEWPTINQNTCIYKQNYAKAIKANSLHTLKPNIELYVIPSSEPQHIAQLHDIPNGVLQSDIKFYDIPRKNTSCPLDGDTSTTVSPSGGNTVLFDHVQGYSSRYMHGNVCWINNLIRKNRTAIEQSSVIEFELNRINNISVDHISHNVQQSKLKFYNICPSGGHTSINKAKDKQIYIRSKVKHVNHTRPNVNSYNILLTPNHASSKTRINKWSEVEYMHNKPKHKHIHIRQKVKHSYTGPNANRYSLLQVENDTHYSNIPPDQGSTNERMNRSNSSITSNDTHGIPTNENPSQPTKVERSESRPRSRPTRWDTPITEEHQTNTYSNIRYINIPYTLKRKPSKGKQKEKKQMNQISNMKLALWNAHSLRNKAETIKEYINEHDLDMVLVTEAWLKEKGDEETIDSLEKNGYKYKHYPRGHIDGGGVAILHKETLDITLPKHPRVKSMEIMEIILKTKRKKMRFVLVYRAEPKGKNYTMSEFYQEMTKLMTYYNTFKDETIYCGDFNHHMNKPHKPDVIKLNEVITTFNKIQHVTEPTHEHGNTLDLIITNPQTSLISHKVDIQASDHNIILMDMSLEKPPKKKKSITFRKIKNIDTDSFMKDINESIKGINMNEDLDTLVESYNNVLLGVLDSHAPMETKEVMEREDTPWTTEEIRPLKTKRRRLERLSRRTGLLVHKQEVRRFNREFNDFLENKRAESYAKIIDDNSDDPKILFKVINKALHKNQDNPMPPGKDNQKLADEFADFFTDKISNIRIKIQQDPLSDIPHTEQRRYVKQLTKFRELTEDEVKVLLKKSSNKHCELDPIPTNLLKICIGDLLPLITKIINLSLRLGSMPTKGGNNKTSSKETWS